jgi:hypothetical protein
MPANKFRSYALFGSLAIAALSCGCEKTNISDILQNPVPFEGNPITIAGKVAESAPAAMPSAYEVDDGTGQIWVVTEKIVLPPKGSQIAVTGLVISSSSQGPFNLPTILHETKRYGARDSSGPTPSGN